MTTKYTRGPWKAKVSIHQVKVEAKDRQAVCSFTQQTRSHEEQVANAKLIALAPDMLQALDEIAKICFHGEAEGNPPLSNADRWRVVNIAREIFGKLRD
jgi:hypothetical protein